MRRSLDSAAGGSAREDIQRAAEILKKGGIVAFPTETVYGLGADAFSPKAVARLFEVKKRPSFDPIIVHVSSILEAHTLWKEIPAVAQRLMKKFWPGALTLVLPKSDRVHDIVTAGLPTVGVRMPSHPMALALLESFGKPIAAPSANLFGYTSPTSAQAVREDLGDQVDFILDGGPSTVGVESTVLKIEDEQTGSILRPGGILSEELKPFLNARPRKRFEAAPRKGVESPGLFESHYAPRTPLALIDIPLEEWLDRLERIKPLPRIGLLSLKPRAQNHLFQETLYLSQTGDLREAASNLFQAMRRLDKMNLDLIIAEAVPEEGIGIAIMDRLKKASGGRPFIL